MSLKNHLTILAILGLLVLASSSLAAMTAETAESKGVASVEERRILAAIEERKEQFRKKEEALQLRETELSSLALELDQKMAELQKMRNRLDELFKEKDAAEKARIKTLSAMYEKMDKAKAGELLAELDWDLSLAIMSQIKTKTRSKIISQMEPQYAIRYTKAYSTLEQD